MTSHSVDEIRPTVMRAMRQAARGECAQWVAFRVETPWRRVRALCLRPATERFFWDRPSEEHTIAAFGVAHVIECRGSDRFAASARWARQVFAAVHTAGDPAPDSAGPLLVGGFGFADEPEDTALWNGFPAARLVLPELTISRAGQRAWCTAIQEVSADDDVDAVCESLRGRVEAALAPVEESSDAAQRSHAAIADHHIASDHPHAHYRSRVDAALREIASGEFEKVVLARSVRVRHEPGFDVTRITESLRDAYPRCTTFAVSRPGGTFLGATPERLVRVEGGRVETAALAGSAPRGGSPEEDAHFGRELRLSKKEQAEHAVVVRALCDALASCCSELDVAEAPRLLKVEGIQHLETPFVGALKGEFSAIELAGRLHPAPSVGGAPRGAALAWLDREEGLDRGWYASPVGWTDASGGGEFCVALRSALLREREAVLFAGAGIVQGSDPESELQETRLKLRGLLCTLLEI